MKSWACTMVLLVWLSSKQPLILVVLSGNRNAKRLKSFPLSLSLHRYHRHHTVIININENRPEKAHFISPQNSIENERGKQENYKQILDDFEQGNFYTRWLDFGKLNRCFGGIRKNDFSCEMCWAIASNQVGYNLCSVGWTTYCNLFTKKLYSKRLLT